MHCVDSCAIFHCLVHLSFNTTVGDIERSDSRRVNYVLCRCICHVVAHSLVFLFLLLDRSQHQRSVLSVFKQNLVRLCADAKAYRWLHREGQRWVELPG